MATEEQQRFVPPYGVPWETFLRTIEKMQEEGLPKRIDRSYLHKQSGNVQTYLMQAFKSFRFTDAHGVVQPLLSDLVKATDEERKSRYESLLREHYAPIIHLGSDDPASPATQGQLEELWTEVFKQTGDTRRKAIRWFLSAAAYAGIELSHLWKAPRAASPGGQRKARTNKGQKDSQHETPPATPPLTPPAGDTYQVKLQGGGTVTMTIAESHFNLSKHRSDRDFVYAMVDSMTEYAAGSNQEVAVTSEGEQEAES